MARLPLWLLLVPTLAVAQVRIAAVRDWEIPGIHHTRVTGRVVTAHGMPVAGAAVRLIAPPYHSIALYETRTGARGDFDFPDVSRDGYLQGMVDPPAGWLPAEFDIPEMSGVFQAGEIRLAPAAAVRVVVETAPGQPFRGDPGELRLSVSPDASQLGPGVTSYAGGVFTVDRLPYGKAELRVEYKETDYSARLVLDAGSRNRVLVARIPPARDEDGQLKIAELIRPWEAPSPQTIEGTVRTMDGSPIDGAEVNIQSDVGLKGYGPSQFATTDADGRYRAQVPRGATPTVLAGDAGENHVSGTDIQAGGALPVEAVVEAPDPAAAARARVRWNGPLGWRTLGSGRTWIAPGLPAENPSIQFVADIPGYFPIFSSARVAKPESGQPSPVAARFSFKSGPVRTLEVRSAGKPLAGAVVEIVPVADPHQLEPVPTVSYTTGPDGRLQLAGDVPGEYGVFVYAPGHPTARALWRAGAPLAIDLTPQPAAIEIAGLVHGQRVRVKPEGHDRAVAEFTVDRSPAPVTVEPGNYLVLAFDHTGLLAAAARATAVGGRTTRVSPGAGRAAEIRVTVPDPNQIWDVTAWSEWNANPEEIEDASAQTVRGTAVLRVGAAGRYRVRAGREHATQWLEREIEVSAREGAALTVPPLTASLAGARPASLWRDSGFLILQAAAPEGWSLGLGPIGLGDAGRFEFRNLPAGRYYAWSLASENPPPLGSAGVPVVLEAGRTAQWKDPAPSTGPPLKVRVTAADGRPTPYALLYVDAIEPANRPAAADSVAGREPRLGLFVPVRNGAAELPRSGAGRLLLWMLSERGRIYSLAADVAPGRTLEIRLPREAP